jgi:aminoglycoside phosphotransferase (APT) family kinase protein
MPVRDRSPAGPRRPTLRPVSGSDRSVVQDLLARATSREVVRRGDGKSGSVFEVAVVDGERYFVKRLSSASDWLMRITGDEVHRPFLVWQHGVMAAAPACIDPTVVAMEIDGSGRDAVLTMVMRDVAEHLVPEGDDPVSLEQHAHFMEHLAALSAAFWNWRDDIGLTPMEHRVRFFAPQNIAEELRADPVPGPIAAADSGWRALADRAPALAATARAVWADPGLVVAPLAATPATFLHGDWKMGNLGSHPDGRTILLDWAYPGAGPLCWDLCWYLALNRARLPESKEDSAERCRAALESHGIATRDWWERQLDLCTVASMATFGWEKALGDDAELGWWVERVEVALRRQRIEA